MRSVFSRNFVRTPTVIYVLSWLLAIAPSYAQSQNPGSSGALILRGELISPPYSIEVIGDGVYVNGLSLARPSETASQPELTSDNVGYNGNREKLFRDFWAAWEGWSRQDGAQIAHEKALQFWRAAPGVLQADFASPQQRSSLAVQFVGRTQALVIELQPPDFDTDSVEQARSQNLQELARTLRYALSHGQLLIVEDEGHSYSAPPGDGIRLLQQIESVNATVPDPASRYRALRQLVPDDEMAGDIAEHFQP